MTFTRHKEATCRMGDMEPKPLWATAEDWAKRKRRRVRGSARVCKSGRGRGTRGRRKRRRNTVHDGSPRNEREMGLVTMGLLNRGGDGRAAYEKGMGNSGAGGGKRLELCLGTHHRAPVRAGEKSREPEGHEDILLRPRKNEDELKGK